MAVERDVPGAVEDVETGGKKNGNVPGRKFGAVDRERTKSRAADLGSVPPEKRIVLRFEHINSWVPLTPEGTPWYKCTVQQSTEKMQVLHDVSGRARPGELLACMGPSGSGKTSLLTILGGRSPFKVDGEITYNDGPFNKEFKKRTAFVTQDDILFQDLTVYETLYFAAMLRLPEKMPKARKIQRVETIIFNLGLDRCKDTIIGGYLRRGVSGGERKRCSIGHELLVNPSLLMLDEPTSGLDSTTALRLVHTLRTLSNGGRTIITTIHQPSSRIYHMLDKLLLLCEGSVIYYGSAKESISYFSSIGYELPYGVNPADFLLDLASGDLLTDIGLKSSDGLDVGLVKEKWSSHAENGEEMVSDSEKIRSHLKESFRQDGKARASLSTADSGDGMLTLDQDDPKHASFVHRLCGSSNPGRASYSRQFYILMIRTLRARRFEAYSGQKILQTTFVGLVCGLLWFDAGQDTERDEDGVKYYSEGTVLDVAGLLFFSVLFCSFQALFAALFTFPNEFRMITKERTSSMYKLSAYYISRTLSDLPMDGITPAIMVTLLYWLGGLQRNGWTFLAYLCTIILSTLVSQSVGLLFGALYQNVKTAQAVSTVTVLTIMLVGGFYVENIPVWIDWLKYLSFIRYGYFITLKLQFRDENVRSGGQVEPISDTNILPLDVNSSVGEEVGALFAMLVGLRFLVYFALRWKTNVRAG